MTQPTAYTKTTNFASDEANNVGGRSTVRTSNLDAEFDNIALTLRQTLQNLARIQRDDGQLTDGLVELYNLSTVARLSLQTAFNPRGAWIASTSYAVGDLIEQNASSYICIVAHSSTVFATDYAAGKWQVLFSSGMVSVADYTALRTYNGTEKSIQVTGYLVGVAPSGFAGTFTRDDGDTTSAENGGTIIVASNGTRWKRVYSGGVDVRWFGAVGDGTLHQLSEYFSSLAAAQAIYPHVTALTQSIDWAAFQAAHESLSPSNSSIGGSILVPANRLGYYLSDTWSIRKRVTIEGANRADQNTTTASKIMWPPDTTGIRCYSTIDSPTGTGADYTRIINLNLNAQAKNVSGYGIESTCVVHIEHCSVAGFKGHGVYVHGQTGGGATGVADVSSITTTQAVSNGGDGFHLQGNDTNVCRIDNCSSRSNAGWGYYDNGAYTNTYLACHEASNVTGSYFSSNSTGLGALYIGCYQEGANTTSLDTNALVIGGVMNRTGNFGGSIWMSGSMLFNVGSSQRHVFLRNNVEVGRIETDNTLRTFAGAKFGTASIFVDMSAASTTGSMSLAQSITTSSSRMNFSNGNGLVGSIVTNGSATAYNTTSDWRLKYNVAPMTTVTYDMSKLAGLGAHWVKLMALRPVTYNWIADDKPARGFIAHEFQEVYPDAVTGKKDETEVVDVLETQESVDPKTGSVTRQEVKVGEKTVPKYQTLDNSFAIPDIVACLQDLRAELDAVKAEFSAYVAAHP